MFGSVQQRVSATAGPLFSTSKRFLVENNTGPETLRTTHYRLAQKMGTKLGQQLLATRFPPTKRRGFLRTRPSGVNGVFPDWAIMYGGVWPGALIEI